MRPAEEPLRKADWTVDAVPDHSSATRCVHLWHYTRSAPNTSTYRHGIFRSDYVWGDPHGVALWIPPTRTAAEKVAGAGWCGVLCLSRLVIQPGMPKNSASFLLAGSMRLVDRRRWPVLLTFADSRLGHTGAIYRATNWVDDGETLAGDVWIGPNGEQRGRKRGGKTLTKSEMEESGFVKAASAPKRRFVHGAKR